MSMIRWCSAIFCMGCALWGAWVLGARDAQDGFLRDEFAGQQHARTNLYEMDISPIKKWNTLALEAIASRQISPPEASRFLAMLHGAMFNAANIVESKYVFYGDVDDVLQKISVDGAEEWDAHALVDGAASEIFTLFFDGYSTLLTQITGKSRDAQESFRIGRSIGVEMQKLRWNDGSHIPASSYHVEYELGRWRATPPYFEDPLMPTWGEVRPFVVRDVDAYDPGPPEEITSDTYARELRQVRLLGGNTSHVRTREQSQIALFWADGKGTYTPPGHWNMIAQDLLSQENTEKDLVQEARLFALLNMTLADTGIAVWRAKYAYEYWRPIDAIRQADNDGNDRTKQDTTWFNFIDTPNFPEYPSGHSAFSAAAATVLSSFFGNDVSFTSHSRGLPGAERSFSSLSEAARESGMSRIYGGIHFGTADRNGRAVGRHIARDVLVASLRER